MTDTLTRTDASAAVAGTSWRYLLGTFVTSVPVDSTTRALQVAQAAVAACGQDADGHLHIDLRPDRVELSLQSAALADLTMVDVDLSRRICDAVAALGLAFAGVTTDGRRRSIQMLEIAMDAMDIPAVRGFWKAVMGYTDEPGRHGPTDALVDPTRQGPAIWFQQMDRPRHQRNRIHLDLTVPHDEAEARVQAALAAGGVRCRRPLVLDPGGHRGQRGLHLHVAGPGVGPGSDAAPARIHAKPRPVRTPSALQVSTPSDGGLPASPS